MKKIVKKVVRYWCDVCGKEYCTKKAVQNCEVKPMEERLLNVGDRIKFQERFLSMCNGESYHDTYGVVKRIFHDKQPHKWSYSLLLSGNDPDRSVLWTTEELKGVKFKKV